MKRILSICAAALMMTGGAVWLGAEDYIFAKDGQPLQIVTTIFPEYDWVRNVLGENPSDAEVVMLLDNGVDLHSYQPTTEDILKISGCDLFVYVGGESDEWVESALAEAVNEDMVVINLLDVLGDQVKEEEIVEGMQAHDHDAEHAEEHDDAHDEAHDEEHDEAHDEEHDEDHDEEYDEAHDEEHDEDHDAAHDAEHDEDHDAAHDHEGGEAESDEHVWLSLRNASVLVQSISEALEKLDPENADLYQSNSADYVEKLTALDKAYRDAAKKAERKTLLFGDRFPFRYLTDDYGLDYYAAFAGCSAETEASFETIIFLAQKTDELSLDTILTIEGSDQSIAQTIRDTTQKKNQQILTMNSLQSVTSRDLADGASYLSIMEENLSVLKKALGCGE